MESIDICKPCAMSTSTVIIWNNIALQEYVKIMHFYSFNIIVVRAKVIAHRTVIQPWYSTFVNISKGFYPTTKTLVYLCFNAVFTKNKK